jgi:predicted nucleic acid-binding protein
VREAICDTSPLQYLHQIGVLNLLVEFYAAVLIPPAVASELERGKTIGVNLPDFRALPWLKIQAPREPNNAPTVAELGAGEKEVLALGMQFPDAVVILDERLGRLHAQALKLTVTGTLGILLRAKVEGRIPRIEPLIAHLDHLGFRLSLKTRAAVLRQAGE